MLVKRGIAVSPGIVTGPAVVLGSEDFRIQQRFVSIATVDSEVGRFNVALDAVCEEISENARLASQHLGEQYGAIFAAHLQVVRDPNLKEEIESLIREKCYSPEFACSRVLRRYAKVFQNLGNRYLAERTGDLFDLEKRLLKSLMGERREELANLTAPVIVLAHNLTPSETASLNKEFVLGFATEVGGHTSHTAILAGALEIPAVVGVGPFLSDVSGGDMITLDGFRGEVIIDPDEVTQTRYRDSEKILRTRAVELESFRRLSSDTKDNEHITLLGNIEFPEEVAQCAARGAEGIGLYRTEFLYLDDRKANPSEEDQYLAYRKVVSAFSNAPVVIRTLDLGADKVSRNTHPMAAASANPVLGLRSIRLSLRDLTLFKTQLRAILRAAVDSDVKIMFPLVSTLLELRQAKMILHDVIEDLDERGVPFRRDVPVGMMVEVPSAALMADEFAREVDFFSIGTNDLIQYTLAADRAEPSVANLYSSGDPSILRLIQNVTNAGKRHNCSVTVCGQMSSDPKFLPLLVGMGIRQLSVTPHAIPELKEVIRSITVSQAEEIFAHAMTLDVARDVENYLKGQLREICPHQVR